MFSIVLQLLSPMILVCLAVFCIAFPKCCKSESTTGIYYVTHPAYNGLVTFGSNITIIKKLNCSLATGGNSCRRDCSRDATCFAFQFQRFTNYTECTLFSNNLCMNASLLSITVNSDLVESIVWEKISGSQQARSCLAKQQQEMPQPDVVSNSAYNDSLPANITPLYVPKLCKDYYQLGFRFYGKLVPVWPWGYGNASVRVQCYGSNTAFFATHYFNNILSKSYYVWALDQNILLEPNSTQFDSYINSMNLTLLSYMVNLPSNGTRKLTFKLTCQECGFLGCWWPEKDASYRNFNISANGTLQFASYTGFRNGFDQDAGYYHFSAAGNCGKFWRFSPPTGDSCIQKTYLFRYQQQGVELKWDDQRCTKVVIMFE